MVRPLPGQRGLPTVAPDVPVEDNDWELAFGFDPANDVLHDSMIVCVVLKHGMTREEAEAKVVELGQSLQIPVYILARGD